MIHANAFIKAGMACRCLVIGSETLSRVTDPHDRDSMIYADGAGATIVEKVIQFLASSPILQLLLRRKERLNLFLWDPPTKKQIIPQNTSKCKEERSMSLLSLKYPLP